MIFALFFFTTQNYFTTNPRKMGRACGFKTFTWCKEYMATTTCASLHLHTTQALKNKF